MSFSKETLKQVFTSVVVGALAVVGTMVISSINKADDLDSELKVLNSKFEQMKETLDDVNGTLGTTSAEIKKIQLDIMEIRVTIKERSR